MTLAEQAWAGVFLSLALLGTAGVAGVAALLVRARRARRVGRQPTPGEWSRLRRRLGEHARHEGSEGAGR